MITNHEIAGILKEIAGHLEMKKVPFKPRAYAKAAEVIQGLEGSVYEQYKKDGMKGLTEIPGVGTSIAEKIEELITTGKLAYYEELKGKTPVRLDELMRIEGLGPQSVQKLYKKLGVTTLHDLEAAARKGKIREVSGFGAKTEKNIIKGIEFLKKSGDRFPLGVALPEARKFEARLKQLSDVEKLTVAGSIRRWKETIGDIDFLVVSKKPRPIMDFFVSMPEVVQVYAHGETKSSVKITSGLDLDIRVVPEESYGAALNYFTGSKDHNVALRSRAIKKGCKLNEYGLYSAKGARSSSLRLSDVRPEDSVPRESNDLTSRQGSAVRLSSSAVLSSLPKDSPSKSSGGKGLKMIAGKTEEELYKALGMDYIEPEMRENTGEIERAITHSLPQLLPLDALWGDLQVQTSWTDGSASIEEMAMAAKDQGLTYIAITDHTKRLAMTGGLDEKKILRQMAEIDRVNKKLGKSIAVLKGSECDILKDGSLDLSDEALAKLDVVGASVHSYFNLSRTEQTKRVIRAMENQNVDILFHPTGRLIGRRAAYDIDIDEVIKVAKRTGTVLEIDAHPDRLDLKDEYIRKAVDAGVPLSIDSDAHHPSHFVYLEYGVREARRGWAERKNIVNAWPLEKMLRFLKR